MRSPSASRPVTSSTVTGGRPPFLRRLLRSPDEHAVLGHARPAGASRRCAAPPVMPKARAISRLPTLLGDVLMNSRISSLPGRPSRLGGRARSWPSGLARHRQSWPWRAVMCGTLLRRRPSRPLARPWRQRPLRRPCPILRLSPPALASALRFARRLLLLAAALGGALGEELDGFVHAERRRVLALGQRGVDLAVLDVGAVAARQHLDLAAVVGMLAEVLEHRRRGALEAALAAGAPSRRAASRRG